MGLPDEEPRPPHAVKGPRPAERDIRPFSSWTDVELVADAAGRSGPLIHFACATGLRPQEWIALQWQDIDFLNRYGLHVIVECSAKRSAG